jgi:Flp pilus assembly protein TadG
VSARWGGAAPGSTPSSITAAPIRGRRLEGGSAVVEFALVLPILLLVALALVQVGLLARDQLLVSEAARAGARAASVEVDDAAARDAAVAAAPGLDPARLTVEIERGAERGTPVTVTVDYEARMMVPIAGWLFPDTVSLAGEATMRREYP